MREISGVIVEVKVSNKEIMEMRMLGMGDWGRWGEGRVEEGVVGSCAVGGSGGGRWGFEVSGGDAAGRFFKKCWRR